MTCSTESNLLATSNACFNSLSTFTPVEVALVGDYPPYEDFPIYQFLHPLCHAKVKTDIGIFLHPIQRLFPLEISPSEDDPLPGGDLLLKQEFQKESASPAAGPERPTQDAVSASSGVTRTGRVIKPLRSLDL
ncbi:hypothetical protein NPIL_385431 [Nephila pilipes]|uniref:Uncharacterized protein n=1 Tax=Nephila pilipes TaxID=299642 RepID=A0A8X6UMG9_NEPPI|nr:hypothetical protein NPIL_385431 [Nephila pilipes]